jgi:hypothetical protein
MLRMKVSVSRNERAGGALYRGARRVPRDNDDKPEDQGR